MSLENKKNTFLFLGTGASAGVPVIGCDCKVCSCTSLRNHRLRSSGLLHVNGKTLLIDTGPDFRMQALLHRIDHIDAVLLTHTHFDHIAGIDELRVYYLKTQKKIPCLLSLESYHDLRIRYHYLFQNGETKTLSTQLDFMTLQEDQGTIEFAGVQIRYMSYFQGGMKVTGFRIGNFAYVSDIRDYDDAIFKDLQGVQKLVLSAPRYEPSALHFSVDEAIEFAQKVKAKETWFTHMAHDIDREELDAKLPLGIRCGFDGLILNVGKNFTFEQRESCR